MQTSETDDGAPYVRPQSPIAVQVEHDGGWFPGVVLSWQGRRMNVRYTVAVGMTYQQVVDQDRVRMLPDGVAPGITEPPPMT